MKDASIQIQNQYKQRTVQHWGVYKEDNLCPITQYVPLNQITQLNRPGLDQADLKLNFNGLNEIETNQTEQKQAGLNDLDKIQFN